MIEQAKAFWDSISGKVKSLVQTETENALRVQRYDVTTAPDGDVMGVTQPFGNNEIFLPYSKEVENATVGDTVLVAWWGSMSNARVYYFSKGYDGGAGGSDTIIASIVFPAKASWTDSGSGYWTAVPTISGVTISAESKIDLQITAAQFITLQSDGVQNLYVENNNAALTAYALKNPPTNSFTLQCTISGTNPPRAPVNPSLDMIYPVGAVYTSTTSLNPANVFGGTWTQIDSGVKYMYKNLLWTNPSPTSDFSAQTIEFSYSSYDLIAVKSRINAYTPITIFQNATNGLDMTAWADLDGVLRKRVATIVESGIEFAAGVQNSTNNAVLVPLQIYGIKETPAFYVWQRTS